MEYFKCYTFISELNRKEVEHMRVEITLGFNAVVHGVSMSVCLLIEFLYGIAEA